MAPDGRPYGVYKFQEIVKERYIISKHTNTGYSETAKITPYEREYLVKLIVEDLKRERDAQELAARKK